MVPPKEVDSDEEEVAEEEEQPQTGAAAEQANAMKSLDSQVVRQMVQENEASKRLAMDYGARLRIRTSAAEARSKQLAAVAVKDEDVAVVQQQFGLEEKVALRALKMQDGDLQKTLRYLVDL